MSDVKKSAAEKAAEIIQNYDGPPIRIMEVCGTHTHDIFRLGIRNMLPENIRLISGPGCPVCVTPVGYIDEAVWLALEQGCTLCTFGDLIKVPGTEMSLAGARAKGAKVDMVYSPIDAVDYAETHPDEQVVFLAVGFETTTPASCVAVRKAKEKGLTNFSLLTANKTMDNAYPRVVTAEGSPEGRELIAETMEAIDTEWRGLGVIPMSGLKLRDEFADYDARLKFGIPNMEGRANPACRCGDVLQGKIRPDQCPCFGKACVPEHPVGACMVSDEGACSAFYMYNID